MSERIDYGPLVKLSDRPEFQNSTGEVRSFIRYGQDGITPVEVGMEFTDSALQNLPTTLPNGYSEGEFEVELQMPDNPTVFNLLTWTWVAGPNGGVTNGHGPEGVYSIGHFDFHFYLNTQAVRDTIKVFDSPDEYAKAIIAPPPNFWPIAYKRPIDQFGNSIGVAPGDGSHWNNVNGPEFKQPSPNTLYQFFESSGQPFGPLQRTVQYGAFNGQQTLLEPMVTPEFLNSKQKSTDDILQPEKYFKTGYFPTKYNIDYVAGDPFSHKVSLSGFQYHEASPVPEPQNQAPTDIVLHNTEIYDNSSYLTLVGTLRTIDPHGPYRVIDDHVYALPFGIPPNLVDDAGGRFLVNGNQIRVADKAQLVAGQSYKITVRSVDSGGLSIQKDFTIKIKDLPEPIPKAISEQAQILLQGTTAWNNYRTANPGIIPNLQGVDIPTIVSSPKGPTGFDLSGANLSNADLSKAIMESTNLSNADLSNAKLNSAFMFGANLSGTKLIGANLRGADLSNVNFTGADLTGADLTGAFLTAGANFTGANLTGAKLNQANLITANLSGANLTNVDFTGASLRLANVSGANLNGAKLTGANTFGVDFTTVASQVGIILPDAPPPPTEAQAALLQGVAAWNQYRASHPGPIDLSGIDIPPIGFDLNGANLKDVKITNAFLEFVNLSGANLSGADLTGTKLFNANLTNANLTNANLTTAFLVATNQTNADFTGADLSGAILSGSTLDGTNLSNANLTNTQLRFVNQSVGRLVALNEVKPVNFSGAKLTGAAFRLALFRDANLTGTDLTQASDVYGADFTVTQATSLIPIQNSNNNLFSIQGKGTKVTLQGKLIGRNSSLLNEMGIFSVDDSSGTINGIAPGAEGYAKAALERGKILFSTITNNPNGFTIDNLERLIELDSESNLRTYLVKNSTTDAVLAGITPESEVLFADLSNQRITKLGDQELSLDWKDSSGQQASDFKDLVVKLKSSNENLTLGTNLQAQSQKEMIDLRSVAITNGQSVKADFTVQREAAFNNFVSFYVVADENGGIDTNGDGKVDLLTGQAGYTQAAISARIADINLTADNQTTATYTGVFKPGAIYAPFIIIDSTPEVVLNGKGNENNIPAVYFPFLGANTDKTDHIRLLGNNVFGFEDLPSGGDKDYNDVIVTAKLSIV